MAESPFRSVCWKARLHAVRRVRCNQAADRTRGRAHRSASCNYRRQIFLGLLPDDSMSEWAQRLQASRNAYAKLRKQYIVDVAGNAEAAVDLHINNPLSQAEDVRRRGPCHPTCTPGVTQAAQRPCCGCDHGARARTHAEPVEALL